jgi:RNA polymerase-binding transcription factor DksA
MSATTPSREDLRAYRQHLQSLAARLSGGVAQLTAEATRPTGAEGTEAEEPAKEPTATSSEGDEEAARGILVSEGQLLGEVREALARIDAGTFGRCERCGLSIEKARVKAVPYARHCIRCAHTENSNPG